MKRIAVVCTHPIQYYAPVFKQLNKIATIKVFYTWGEGSINKFDKGFGKKISWDIPLLDGYDYEFLENTSKRPGSSHFMGIRNPRAIERIKVFQPDVILIYGWSFYSHLKLLVYFHGRIPVWFRGDSNLMDAKGGIKNSIRIIFLTWVYSHVDKAFYVGTANKQYFLRFGMKEEQVIFAPHAIDNDRFRENRLAEASSIRSALGVEPDDILFLFSGKFEVKKDPLILLDAFSRIQKAKAHLLFVGNGELEFELKQKAKLKGLKNVHFQDFQNQRQMPVIYQACDVFCLPSKGPGETWGLAVNEAMAASKPVLVSNKVGCAVDLVRDHSNGFVFQAGDSGDLQKKLMLFLSDKGIMSSMGKESFSIIQTWSFMHQVSKYAVELKCLES